MKKKLLFGTLFLLTVISMSLAGIASAQNPDILNKSPPYPYFEQGGQGDYTAQANKNTGYVYARSSGNAWARAGIGASNHYTGLSGDQYRILIAVTDGYAERNGAAGCRCDAKLWIRFIDLTTSQILYQEEQDLQTQAGNKYYYFPTSGCRQQDIFNEHDYECWAGAVTRTDQILWWSSSAKAYGTISNMKVFRCGY